MVEHLILTGTWNNKATGKWFCGTPITNRDYIPKTRTINCKKCITKWKKISPF